MMQDLGVHREHFPPLPQNTAPLWVGILGVPGVWGFLLQAVFALSHQACPHQKLWVLHILHIFGLILIVVGGAVCLHYWRRQSSDEEDRTRFLASWGLMSAALFFLATLAQTIAGFLLDPCAT